MGEIDPIPELPQLEPGVTLLESTAPGPLQTLVVDHVLLERKPALWIDTRGYCQTEPLVEIAPSARILDRIQVARAFTAYQHYSLCETVLGEDRYAASMVARKDVGLIVVPAVDALYRDPELMDDEGEWILAHGLAKLAAAARRFDVPILVTRTRDDTFAEPIDRLVDKRLCCESTEHGPRFEGESFETLVYPLGDGWFQTTLAFWAHILKKRKPAYTTVVTPDAVKGVA